MSAATDPLDRLEQEVEALSRSHQRQDATLGRVEALVPALRDAVKARLANAAEVTA